MIYTSYYGNNGSWKESDVVVSISDKTPMVKGFHFKALAPDKSDIWSLKNGNITEDEFTRNYLNKLNSIDEEYMRKVCIFLNYYRSRDDKDLLLCCWEKSDKFCHRHILAKYLNEKYNMEITEKC